MMPTAAKDRDIEAQRMMDSVQALVRRFALSERADVACCGVTVAQAATLEALRASGPMRQGELGRKLGITPSTLTRNLSRLVDAGLVERLADPEDARATRIRLSRAGEGAAETVRRQENAFARDVLDQLPAERRDVIVEGLQDLLAAVRVVTETCCPGAYDHLMTDFPKETNDGTCCR
jgi:DNA-binding MarR family transcriptional regulator